MMKELMTATEILASRNEMNEHTTKIFKPVIEKLVKAIINAWEVIDNSIGNN